MISQIYYRKQSKNNTFSYLFIHHASQSHLRPNVIGLPASGRPAEAEAVSAAVRIRGRQAEGAETTGRALLAFHIGLTEAGTLRVTLAKSVIVTL